MAVIQTRVLHRIRNTFRLASRRDWDKMAKDLRPVYTAVNEADAQVPSTSSTTNGATATRKSAPCGPTPGPSSCRSWTTCPRSAG